tara:strand:- start:168 stop:293 length:126 start_codon:yes stop_codon:yes gene_type:complete
MKYNAAVSMYKSGSSWGDIQKRVEVSRSTISRWLKEAELIK